MAKNFAVLIFFGIMSAICQIYSVNVCKSKPINIDVIVDWTKNIDTTNIESIKQIIVKIISGLPDHSTVNVNVVSGSIITQIVSVSTPYANMSWSAKLYDYDLPQRGNSISLAAIDDELKAKFTVNKYRKISELAVVFLSDLTKVVGTTSILYKKKAILWLFGNSIPSVYFPLAITKSHTHLVREGGKDLPGVMNSVVNQIACASEHVCDRDEYRLVRGIKCLSCAALCGKDFMKPSDTCDVRCPYLPRKEEDRIKPTSATVESPRVEEAQEDHKDMSLGAIAGAIIIIVISLIIIGLYCFPIYRLKHAMTPSNSQETMPKIPVNCEMVPLGVQESRQNSIGEADQDISFIPERGADADEQTPILQGPCPIENDHIPCPHEPGAAAGIDEHIPFHQGPEGVVNEHIPSFTNLNINSDTGLSDSSMGDNDESAEFSLSFCNEQELDANAHTFGDPGFQSVHP